MQIVCSCYLHLPDQKKKKNTDRNRDREREKDAEKASAKEIKKKRITGEKKLIQF